MNETRSSRQLMPLGILSIAVLMALGCAAALEEEQLGDQSTESTIDPLWSWRDGPTKQAILEFVARVTDPASADYVETAERIAVFDNDGTLWVEQPAYVQLLFALDRVRALASDNPQWRDEQPFKAILENDQERLGALSSADLDIILTTTHSGMTVGGFRQIAREWLSTARHPRYDNPFTDCVYQPMLEVLEYLRANDFKTFIVSGGGIEFMRVFSEEVYGIPPDQVVGSSTDTELEMRDGRPIILRLPEMHFLNDKAGKPLGINRFIGQRPIVAFGNSDGDLQMLQYTAAGEGSRFMALIHHDDAEREWAYDRESHIGRLARALDEANERGWTVVSMQEDWYRIFPWEESVP